MGVATTVSVEGMGAALATCTRGSLASADVAGNVKAASAALTAANDQREREQRRSISLA
jgi:hypothetical protein